MQYPEGYLEAQAAKRAQAEDDASSEEEKPKKGKKRRASGESCGEGAECE
jgi:hypothetical protein